MNPLSNAKLLSQTASALHKVRTGSLRSSEFGGLQGTGIFVAVVHLSSEEENIPGQSLIVAHDIMSSH